MKETASNIIKFYSYVEILELVEVDHVQEADQKEEDLEAEVMSQDQFLEIELETERDQ